MVDLKVNYFSKTRYPFFVWIGNFQGVGVNGIIMEIPGIKAEYLGIVY